MHYLTNSGEHLYSEMPVNEPNDATMNMDNNLHTNLTETHAPWAGSHSGAMDDTPRPSNLNDLRNPNFYKREGWFNDMCEVLFKLQRRNATVKDELYYGVIHYISCLYCLAVVPQQLAGAGYGSRATVVSVALCSGVGSIFCGLFANLPFVLAPPTVVSIFLSVFLQQVDEGPREGSIAVILSGFLLVFFGWKPLGRLAAHLIPVPIQVGTAVGIGLLTALAGSTEVNLVESGEYTVLKIGPITPQVCIALSGVILIAIATNFHFKGSFCLAVIFCSIVWWIYDNDFPNKIAAVPNVDTLDFKHINKSNTGLLTVDLIFLYVLYLNGLMTSLSNLAVLTREDSTIPRGRWIFIVCGIFTIVSGLLTSAPILVSPESASSIKEGAKTGLSAVVAGLLFLCSLFFSPLFEFVPSAGTSPVLIMIGVILFQNVSRIDWRNVASAAPAFVVLFYIPFTYSIIQGVVMGYVVYLTIALFNGELLENTADFLMLYFPASETYLMEKFPRLQSRSNNSKASSFDHAGRELEQTNKETTTLQRPRRNTLFDDSNGNVGHIVGGDMSMTTTSTSGNPNYNSVGMTSSARRSFADFGTAFRNIVSGTKPSPVSDSSNISSI